MFYIDDGGNYISLSLNKNGKYHINFIDDNGQVIDTASERFPTSTHICNLCKQHTLEIRRFTNGGGVSAWFASIDGSNNDFVSQSNGLEKLTYSGDIKDIAIIPSYTEVRIEEYYLERSGGTIGSNSYGGVEYLGHLSVPPVNGVSGDRRIASGAKCVASSSPTIVNCLTTPSVGSVVSTGGRENFFYEKETITGSSSGTSNGNSCLQLQSSVVTTTTVQECIDLCKTTIHCTHISTLPTELNGQTLLSCNLFHNCPAFAKSQSDMEYNYDCSLTGSTLLQEVTTHTGSETNCFNEYCAPTNGQCVAYAYNYLNGGCKTYSSCGSPSRFNYGWQVYRLSVETWEVSKGTTGYGACECGSGSQCECSNGVAAVGEECGRVTGSGNMLEKCVSCDEGYWLETVSGNVDVESRCSAITCTIPRSNEDFRNNYMTALNYNNTISGTRFYASYDFSSITSMSGGGNISLEVNSFHLGTTTCNTNGYYLWKNQITTIDCYKSGLSNAAIANPVQLSGCLQNHCICHNGVAPIGSDCEMNDQLRCTMGGCNSGYNNLILPSNTPFKSINNIYNKNICYENKCSLASIPTITTTVNGTSTISPALPPANSEWGNLSSMILQGYNGEAHADSGIVNTQPDLKQMAIDIGTVGTDSIANIALTELTRLIKEENHIYHGTYNIRCDIHSVEPGKTFPLTCNKGVLTGYEEIINQNPNTGCILKRCVCANGVAETGNSCTKGHGEIQCVLNQVEY